MEAEESLSWSHFTLCLWNWTMWFFVFVFFLKDLLGLIGWIVDLTLEIQICWCCTRRKKALPLQNCNSVMLKGGKKNLFLWEFTVRVFERKKKNSYTLWNDIFLAKMLYCLTSPTQLIFTAVKVNKSSWFASWHSTFHVYYVYIFGLRQIFYEKLNQFRRLTLIKLQCDISLVLNGNQLQGQLNILRHFIEIQNREHNST